MSRRYRGQKFNKDVPYLAFDAISLYYGFSEFFGHDDADAGGNGELLFQYFDPALGNKKRASVLHNALEIFFFNKTMRFGKQGKFSNFQ